MRVDGGSSSPTKSSPPPPPPEVKAPSSGAKAGSQTSGQGSSEKKAAPAPVKDSFVDARSLSGASKRDRESIGELATGGKASATANRDGSVTRSTETKGKGKSASSESLTTKKGLLGDSRLKYSSSQTRGDKTTTRSYTADRDVFGRVTSSRTTGTSTVKGNKTTASQTTTEKGAAGVERETRTKTTTKKVGETETTHSVATTTASRNGEKLSGKPLTVTSDKKETTSTRPYTRKDGTAGERKTVTSTEHTQTRGTDHTSANVNGYADGTYQVGGQRDRKTNYKGGETSWSKSQQRKEDDKGFSQKQDSKLNKAGRAADALGFKNEKELGKVGGDKDFAKAEAKGSADGKYGSASYTATAKVTGTAKADAKVGWDSNGVTVSGGAKLGITAEASVHGEAKTKAVTVAGVKLDAGVAGNAKVSASLTAEAEGKVQVSRNPPTAVIEGSAGASAVLKAEADVKVHAGPFAVKASGYGSVGAEAKASGVLGYHDGKLEVGGKLGAALGVGLGGSATVEVDVKQIGTMAVNTAKTVANDVAAIKNVADVNHDGKVDGADAKAAGSAVVNGAKSVVSSGAKKVASWFGF